MKVYSCSPFMNEFDILDLKISEELDDIDGLFLIESNQTLHCNPKPLNLQGTKYEDMDKVHCCFIEDQFSPSRHTPNDVIQKNSVLNFFEYEDDDVLICADVDEINKKEDLPFIIDSAKKHGFVKLRMHCYYYKINLRRGDKKGWKSSFAITGKEMRRHKGDIYRLRKMPNTPVIATDGKHFSYLMDPEGISYKIKNAGHPEFMGVDFTDPKRIEERLIQQLDLFDRKDKEGNIQKLTKCEVDDTYPNTILNNLDYWSKYIV